MTTQLDKRRFGEWLQALNKYLENRVGLGYLDLPDAPYWGYWESGMTVAEAVEVAAEDYWDMPSDLLDF